MITFLLNLITNFLAFLIALFPSGTGFPSEVHSAFSTLGGYIGLLNKFIPLDVLLWCLLLLFSVEIAIFGFKTIKWVISHIPFLGGRG